MNESSLNDLFNSAVAAFPRTRRRQHVTEPIRIVDVQWVPFLGVRTLFVKARALNEEREYRPMILFKGVVYGDEGATLRTEGGEVTFRLLSNEGTQALLRCNCPDFHWRFNYYDHVDRSLYGRVRRPYESRGGPPANPLEMPGMCKHLMKLWYTIQDSGIFLT